MVACRHHELCSKIPTVLILACWVKSKEQKTGVAKAKRGYKRGCKMEIKNSSISIHAGYKASFN